MSQPPPGGYYGSSYAPPFGSQIYPQDYLSHQAAPDDPCTQMSQTNYSLQTGYPSSRVSPYPVYPGNAFPVLGHDNAAHLSTNSAFPHAYARPSPAITPMPLAGPPSLPRTGSSSGYGRHVYAESSQLSLNLNYSQPASTPAMSPPRPKTRNPQLDPSGFQQSLPLNHGQYGSRSSHLSAPVMIPTSPYQPQAHAQTRGGYMRRPHTPAEESPYFRPLREGESLLLTPFHPKRAESYADDFEDDDDDDESLDYDFIADDRQRSSAHR